MNRLLPLLLLAAAAPASATLPNAAQLAPQAAAAPMGDAEFRTLLARIVPLAQSDECKAMLALADPAVPRLAGKPRNVLQLLRIPCLGAVGRDAEVPAIYREMIAVEPQSPMVRSVGVFVAASGGDFKAAGARLAELAEQNPESLGAITSGIARGITQALTQEHDTPLRDRVTLALARADWRPDDRPEMREDLAQGAIEALLAKAQVDEAGTLLPRVTMPELLVGMAIERRYQPLWSAIEAKLGAHGRDAVDPFAADALDAYTRNPTDLRVLRDAVRAFTLLARYPEAGELGGRVTIAAGMSEEAVGVVRYHAQALDAEGTARVRSRG